MSAPFPPPPHHCTLREKTSPRVCGSLSASAWVVWESAEGIKPPSASTLSHVGFPPLPQPLHAVALHGYAKGRYAIKRSPFAGCWCSGSLNVPRPLAVPLRCCRLRRLLCGGIQHNGVLCKAHAPVKAPALRVRIRAFMSRALRVNTATKSTSTSISFVEWQQNGAGVSSPLRLLLLGPLRRFILPAYLLSLRVLFIVPAHPACQATRGRAALLLSRSPATLPFRPKWLP